MREWRKRQGPEFYIEKRNWFNELKSAPCQDCNTTYPPYVMDFDHVRGKKLFGVTSSHHRSKKQILEEVAKCELVCANCHRIRTQNRRNQDLS